MRSLLCGIAVQPGRTDGRGGAGGREPGRRRPEPARRTVGAGCSRRLGGRGGTSSRTMRPPGPVPLSWPTSSPISRASLRAIGLANTPTAVPCDGPAGGCWRHGGVHRRRPGPTGVGGRPSGALLLPPVPSAPRPRRPRRARGATETQVGQQLLGRSARFVATSSRTAIGSPTGTVAPFSTSNAWHDGVDVGLDLDDGLLGLHRGDRLPAGDRASPARRSRTPAPLRRQSAETPGIRNSVAISVKSFVW